MQLTEATHARLAQLGARGEAWARALPDLLRDLERRFHCSIEAPLEGGSAAFVARVRLREGAAAVLKLAVPAEVEAAVEAGGTTAVAGSDSFARELAVLTAAPAGAYVSVLAFDREHRALLFEALGPSLAGLELPIEARLEHLGHSLARGWMPASAAPSFAGCLPTCLEQVAWLGRLFAAAAADPACPCHPATVARARTFLERRRAAFELSRAVVIHADAHPQNVLASGASNSSTSTTAELSFKLIDPEGLLSTPEHDLAIPLREWNPRLLAAADPAATFVSWAQRIAAAAGGRDPIAIAEWAFLERVSSGLFLRSLGLVAESEPYLAAADRLRDSL
jgi:streptomycin 6-kinase